MTATTVWGGTSWNGEGILDSLNQLFKGHPQTSSSTWDLVRNADSLAEPQTC